MSQVIAIKNMEADRKYIIIILTVERNVYAYDTRGECTCSVCLAPVASTGCPYEFFLQFLIHMTIVLVVIIIFY